MTSNQSSENLAVSLDELVRQQVLQRVSTDDPRLSAFALGQLTERVVEIVQNNWHTKRLHRVMVRSGRFGEMTQEVVSIYVDRVLDCFLQEHKRVEPLRAGDEQAWDAFRRYMVHRASAALARHAPSAPPPTPGDLAQDVCSLIWRHTFPYDVPFDAWVGRILLTEIKGIGRSRDFMDRYPQRVRSFDQPLTNETGLLLLAELLEDEQQHQRFSQVELGEWLVRALESLPRLIQRQVLLLTYLAGYSDEQIAAHLNKSRSAVATIRHRSLRYLATRLRTIPPDAPTTQAEKPDEGRPPNE